MITDRQNRALKAAELIVRLKMVEPPLSQVADIVLAAMVYEAEACAKVAESVVWPDGVNCDAARVDELRISLPDGSAAAVFIAEQIRAR